MAELWSRMNAIVHEDPEYGRFEPDGDGAFAFPDDLSDRLLRQHVRKKPMWEDAEMRALRLHQEDERRHRDPAVLYSAVAELVQLNRQAQSAAVPADLAAELAALRAEVAGLRAAAAEPPAAKPGARKAPAKPAATGA